MLPAIRNGEGAGGAPSCPAAPAPALRMRTPPSPSTPAAQKRRCCYGASFCALKTSVETKREGGAAAAFGMPPAEIALKKTEKGFLLPPQAVAIRPIGAGGDENENENEKIMAASWDADDASADTARERVAEIESSVEQVLEFGAVDRAIGILGRAIVEHSACPAATRYCCTTLLDLAEAGQGGMHGGDGDGDGGAALLRIADVLVQREGGRWLACLARALDRHAASEEEVAEAALGVIKLLSVVDFDSNSDDGDESGAAAAATLAEERRYAARAVARAMGRRRSNPILQAEGCSVLSNLALLDARKRRVAVVSAEEIDAILQAMAMHPEDLTVQHYACFALKHLAFAPRNAAALAGAGLPARGLLEAAAKNFPVECQRSSKVALKRMAKGSNECAFNLTSSVAQPQHVSSFPRSDEGQGGQKDSRASPSSCGGSHKDGTSSSEMSEFSRRCSSPIGCMLDLPPSRSGSGNVAQHHSSSAGHDHAPIIRHSLECHPHESPCPADVIISKEQNLAASSNLQHAHRNTRGDRDTSNEQPRYYCGSVDASSPRSSSPPPPSFSGVTCEAAASTGGGLADELLKNAVRSGQRGEYASARAQFEIVLDMKTAMSTAGPEHAASSDLVDLLHCLGYACAAAGDAPAAIDKYGKSLAMRRKLLRGAPDDEAAADALGSLGVLHLQTLDLGTAEAFLTEAIQTKRACHQRRRKEASTTTGSGSGAIIADLSLCRELESLADLERLRGEHDKAEDMYNLAARWCCQSEPEGAEEAAGSSSASCSVATSSAPVQQEILLLAGISCKLGLLAAEKGDHMSAGEYTEAALDAKRRVYGHGARNADLVALLCTMGYVAAASGDMTEATRRYEESLEMQRLMSAAGSSRDGGDSDSCSLDDEPRNHPLPRSANLAHTLTSLGLISAKLGRRDAAKSYLEEALDAKLSILGEPLEKEEEIDEATSREFLDLLQSLGEACDVDEDAEVYFEEALEHASRLLNIEEELEQRQHAAGLVEESDTRFARIFDVQIKVADLLSELGLIVLRRGDLESASKRCGKAVEIYLAMQESDEWNPLLHATRLVDLLSNLGYILAIMGDYPSAIDKYDLSLRLQQSIAEPGTFTIEMAQTQNTLGVLYLKNGDHILSQKFLSGALSIQRRIYGSDSEISTGIAETVRNLGEVCMARGKFELAEAYFEKAFSIFFHAPDPTEHDDSSNSNGGGGWWGTREAGISDLNSKLGTLAGRRGDVASAREHFEAALEIKRNLLYEPDDANLDLVGGLHDLGYACAAQGDLGAAIRTYEESLEMLRCIHGPDTPCEDISKTMGTLGLLKRIVHTIQVYPN